MEVKRRLTEEANRQQKNAPVPDQHVPTISAKLTLQQVGKLSKLISEWYSRSELQDLSLFLSIDYENLPNEKDIMARELVLQAKRENKIQMLWEKLHEERSHVDWSQALVE